MLKPRLLEDQWALAPVFGKLVTESLRKPGITEEVIRFGEHRQQIGLLMWPEREEIRRRSLVYFLHGGGWNSGSPLLYRFAGHFFAGLGFPTLLGGYRLVPAVRFPGQMQDARACLEAGLGAFAGRDVQIDRVIAGGISAGAQMAALLVYCKDACQPPVARLLKPGCFSAFLSICGPLSFSHCTQPELRNMISAYIGDQDWERADPIRHVDGSVQLPAMLIHGDRDPLVEVENTHAFAAALNQVNSGPVQEFLVAGVGHAEIARLFVERDSPAARALMKWLVRVD